MLLNTARVLLVALIFVGGYCLHAFSDANGLFPALTKLTEGAVLDDGTIYDAKFTGIPQFDELLGFLLAFFWPVANGKHPYLSAHSVLFAGQFVAAWTVTVLEGYRKENLWRIASFTTVAGLLIQILGAALVVPAFLALQLFTTSATKLAGSNLESHSVPESDLLALPYSVTIGFVIPTIFMSLPSPKVLPQQSKIYAILFWQAFPLWLFLIQTVVSKTVFGYSQNAPTSRRRQIKLHGRVYLFAFYIAMAIHIASVAMSVSTSWMTWKSGATGTNQLELTHFFIPPNPLSQKQASTVAEGAFWFIQFDYLISSVAYLVWSVALRYGSSHVQRAFGVRRIFDLAVSVLITGPLATALTVVWERDDNIFYDTKSKGIKESEDKKRS